MPLYEYYCQVSALRRLSRRGRRHLLDAAHLQSYRPAEYLARVVFDERPELRANLVHVDIEEEAEFDLFFPNGDNFAGTVEEPGGARIHSPQAES